LTPAARWRRRAACTGHHPALRTAPTQRTAKANHGGAI
jgi:hypothetical protein